MEADLANIPVDWGVPDVSSMVHPVYFAKCLKKVIATDSLFLFLLFLFFVVFKGKKLFNVAQVYTFILL